MNIQVLCQVHLLTTEDRMASLLRLAPDFQPILLVLQGLGQILSLLDLQPRKQAPEEGAFGALDFRPCFCEPEERASAVRKATLQNHGGCVERTPQHTSAKAIYLLYFRSYVLFSCYLKIKKKKKQTGLKTWKQYISICPILPYFFAVKKKMTDKLRLR